MCEKVTDAFRISKPKNCVKRLSNGHHRDYAIIGPIALWAKF